VITISKEDYLKAIHEAEGEGQHVISATLAHWLKVSPPAVTMALKRLVKDGLVRVRADGLVRLTGKGRAIARRTVFRHHLIERMLTEIFGMEWYKVHDEAERLEHAVSTDFERKLIEKLGREPKCPHGNLAVPQTPAARRRQGLALLSAAEAGKSYRVASVYERDRKLLEFLDRLQIRPGSRLSVTARNYDQTLNLRVNRHRFSLGASAAERVWVVPA